MSTAEKRLLSVKKKLMDKITECERKESDLVEGIKNGAVGVGLEECHEDAQRAGGHLL